MIKFYKEDWHGVKKISKKKYRSYVDALSKYEGGVSGYSEETNDGKLKRALEFGGLKIVAVFDDWEELEEASKW